ncbi:MAG: hypothetical protein ACRDM7_21835 [Thermoleophilaceae bacterium]
MTPEARRTVFRSVGYEPNQTQAQIHDDPSLLKLIAGGERAGKSRTGAEELVGNSPFGLLYWIVGPDYRQTRPEFEYARDDLLKLDAIEAISEPRDDESPRWMALRGGLRIVTRSGGDAKKLASEAPDGILMVEAAQHAWENFQKLHNRLAEARKKGRGWMYVSGTFEGSFGWYPDIFTQLQAPNAYGGRSFSLPTWSNTLLFPGGYEDPEIVKLRATNPHDLFMERFGGEPCPPKELVFREFSFPKHVLPIRFGPVETPMRALLPVDGVVTDCWTIPESSELEVWIDPGYAGAYAVLFVAVCGGLVFVVDEVYAVGKVGETVIAEATGKTELFERVRRGVIDVAGRQHNAMESQVELWQRLTRLPLASRAVPIADGIARHRVFLQDPMTLQPRIFHDPRCVGTLSEYGKYRYGEVKELRDERELPIDANNHAMKAIAYGLMNRYGVVDRLSKPQPRNLIRGRRRDA